MATLLIESDQFPATDEHVDMLSRHIDLFTRTSSIQEVPRYEGNYNFWEATGGRATIRATDLRRHRISSNLP